jgi:hypothetical protein
VQKKRPWPVVRLSSGPLFGAFYEDDMMHFPIYFFRILFTAQNTSKAPVVFSSELVEETEKSFYTVSAVS